MVTIGNSRLKTKNKIEAYRKYIEDITAMFDIADRIGAEHDEPEGCRLIQISDTLVKELSERGKALLE